MHFSKTRNSRVPLVPSFSDLLLLLVCAVFLLCSASSAFPIESNSVSQTNLKPGQSESSVQLHERTESLTSASEPKVGVAVKDRRDDAEYAPPHLSKRAKVAADYQMPGVRVCVSQMELFASLAKGLNLELPWVFYTGYPIETEQAIAWAAKHFNEKADPARSEFKFMAWGRTFFKSWQSASLQHLRDSMVKAKFPPEIEHLFADRYVKNIAQAFAAQARGDIYLVVSDDNNPESDPKKWSVDTAWGGWEFPVLTRNTKVNNIYRVDPKKGAAPKLIWKKGQGEFGQSRGTLLPLYPAYDSETGKPIGLK